MNIINNTLNNKTQIKVDDRTINVNDIEKIERNPFSFKVFKLNIKLITGEVIQEKYKSLSEMHKSYEKFVTEAGFDFSGKLREERVKYANGNIHLKDLIIISSELIGIRRIRELRKGLKSMMYRGVKGMYDTKIELFLRGGNVITLEVENEEFVKIMKMIKVSDNKIGKYNMKLYRNDEIWMYKIENISDTDINFKDCDILLDRNFFINDKYIKYVIIKNNTEA